MFVTMNSSTSSGCLGGENCLQGTFGKVGWQKYNKGRLFTVIKPWVSLSTHLLNTVFFLVPTGNMALCRTWTSTLLSGSGLQEREGERVPGVAGIPRRWKDQYGRRAWTIWFSSACTLPDTRWKLIIFNELNEWMNQPISHSSEMKSLLKCVAMTPSWLQWILYICKILKTNKNTFICIIPCNDDRDRRSPK